LPQLPADSICERAVVAYSLAGSGVLRLARPVVTRDERMIWQVPMMDGFPPDLLGHALNALATAQRVSGPELRALAASPSLASLWMREHMQPKQPTN
jgi:hypothetical protein